MNDANEPIATAAKLQTKRPRKMAREPNSSDAGEIAAADVSPTPAKRESKTELVLDLLKRTEGASIDQLAAATGWLPHTTRAALTGLKKKGHVVTSEKTDGVRHYRVGAGAA